MGEWAEFGFAGVVTGTLFAALAFVVKMSMAAIERQYEAHREDIRGLQTEHRGERDSWRASIVAADEKVAYSMGRLADEIRESSRFNRG